MDFSYESIVANCLRKITSFDRVVEFKVPLADGNNISRVLAVSSTGKTVTVSAGDNQVHYDGRVNFKLVYVNHEGEIMALDYFADFSERVSGEVRSGTLLQGELNVLETDISTSNEIKLTSVVEVTIYGAERVEGECITAAPEECECERKKITITTLADSKVYDFEVTDEEQCHTDVEKVLMTDCDVIVTELKAGDGVAFAGGDFVATITYLAEGEIRSASYNVPFSEEIPMSGVSFASLLSASATVKNVRVVLAGEEGDNILRIEALVSVKINAFEKTEREVIDDVFMLTNEMVLERGNIEYIAFEQTLFFRDKFIQSAMLAENRSAVREIVAVTNAQNNIASATPYEDSIRIEGVVGATIIYKDENGLNSVKAELPYSLSFKADIDPSSYLKVSGVVESISARVKRDREIEVTTKLIFKVEVLRKVSQNVLKKAEVGEAKEINTSVISVYIATDGDTIWDVSKAVSATPRSILEQNPSVTGKALSDGDRIIYFRKLG